MAKATKHKRTMRALARLEKAIAAAHVQLVELDSIFDGDGYSVDVGRELIEILEHVQQTAQTELYKETT